MRRLFRQFSTPGGVPSHVGPPTPGSIHEGGELGYVLAHAFGAVFDNPDLIAVAVVGDGEAETGPLEGSWKGISFLNPARDGAVLPVLHLNGYKISGPTVLGRASDEDIRSLLAGHGYDVHFVEGDDPKRVHADFAAALDSCWDAIRAIQSDARGSRSEATSRAGRRSCFARQRDGPARSVVDGVRSRGDVPSASGSARRTCATTRSTSRMLEAWMRSYRPESCSTSDGRLDP